VFIIQPERRFVNIRCGIFFRLPQQPSRLCGASVATVKQEEYQRGDTARCQNDQQIDGGKDDCGDTVEQESCAEAVQMPIQEDHFSNVHQEGREGGSDRRDPNRNKPALSQEERTDEHTDSDTSRIKNTAMREADTADT